MGSSTLTPRYYCITPPAGCDVPACPDGGTSCGVACPSCVRSLCRYTAACDITVADGVPSASCPAF